MSISYDTLRVGEVAMARAEARDQSGAPMRVPEPTWTSSNPSVATVTYVGYVTAVGIGTARIAATALGQAAEVTVHVTPIPVAGVLLGPHNAVLAPGERLSFVATAVDAAGRTLSGRPIAWLSSDSSVAAVSGDGVLTAIAPGVVSVSAISESVYASVNVRVSGPAGPVARITVSPGAASLAIGQSLHLETTLEDADGDLATNRVVAWTSIAPNVATVSSTGLVQAIAAGKAVIEATSEGQRGTAELIIVDPLDAVTVRVSDPELNEIVADTMRIYASATGRNPIAAVHAKAVNRETGLVAVPAGAGPFAKGIAWVGTLNLVDLHYGPYELVITAIDAKGNQGIATIAFQRGAREGSGGAKLPPRNR
ncbi:MAG: Ig-like domain-containing protein [Gemmatimonadaceae bacterium]